VILLVLRDVLRLHARLSSERKKNAIPRESQTPPLTLSAYFLEKTRLASRRRETMFVVWHYPE
jgi:hypothetical protein